ncbi:MAG TPA: CrcB family protein [Nitrososphaerales archaeon]|nr:CrcB family protein [Nitrososphaerales archaeon]
MAIWKLDLLYLAIGALSGVYLRYKIGSDALFVYGVPVTILFINVLGSFILGLSMTTVQRFGLSQNYVILLGIGFCGSFTTMSSFAFEGAALLDAGKLLLGLVYIVLNVVLSLLGIVAGRALIILVAGLL